MKEFSNTGVYLSPGSACAKALAEKDVKLASKIFSQTTEEFKKLIPNKYDRAWLMAKSKGEEPPKPPKPLKVGDLQFAVEQMRLLSYLLYCARVPYDCCLPLPPPEEKYPSVDPGSAEEAAEIKRLLKIAQDQYALMMFRLAEDQATNAERERIRKHVEVAALHWWLPDFTWKDIVKMPVPPGMNHKDWVFAISKCDAHDSLDRKYVMFVGEENMQRFQQYLATKQQEPK